MNWKKSALYGFLFWIIIFAEVSIIGFIPALSTVKESGFEFNSWGLIIHFIAIAIISCLLGKAYFKNKTVTFEEGMRAYFPIVVVALALDVIITVPLFIKSYITFFSQWTLWAGVVLGWIVFAYKGACRKK